jgi:uncharacterized membrane protein YedE/YeeE
MTGGVAFLVGLVFALGLGIGGMTQPPRVLGFLDVTGAWDPTLAFVMVAAVLVHGVGVRLAARRAHPVYAPAFALPTRRDITARLIGGAAVFGIGWGLAGLCPGPALTALGGVRPGAVLFVLAMLAGMVLAGLSEPRPAGAGHETEEGRPDAHPALLR